ncbi:MAG: glycosyltransferase [Vicinamibacterales bacterium]
MGAVSRRILLTGGGTAGHVNPALAIGRAIAGESSSLLFVGVRGRAEAQIVPREGIPIKYVRASSFPGSRPSLALARFFFDMARGTARALFILLSFRPDTIVGTGGFASAPIVFAAAFLRRLRLSRARLYLHEQNAVPGKLNVVIGRAADRVFLTFPESAAFFPENGLVVGYPLRQSLIPGSGPRAPEVQGLDFSIPEGRHVVLAFGGSQGARTINRAVVDALGLLLPHREKLFLVHGTGLSRGPDYDAAADTRKRLEERYAPEERSVIETFYVSRPYFHAIERIYERASLVVGRAGAGTLNELAARGLPAVIVPKVNLPGEHQVLNARAMARCGGAVVLYEETVCENGRVLERLSGEELARTIIEILDDPERLRQMAARSASFARTDALAQIRRVVEADHAAGPSGAPKVSAAAAAAPLPFPANARQVGSSATACGDDVALLSNEALLRRLEAAAERGGPRWNIEEEFPVAGDRAYLASRAASLLADPSWERRNLGVKLIGLLQAREKLPLVLALLEDRTPAAPLERLFGGDFRQVGFIRRNALTALARLRVVNEHIERVLVQSMSDPYFEARAEAARSAAALGTCLSENGRTELTTALVRLLSDRWIEVAAAAAQALGRVGRGEAALRPLLNLAGARFWKVRAAALEGLCALVERGEAGTDLRALEPEIRRFVLTSTDFRPQFDIKAAYARLMAVIERAGRSQA